MHRTALVTVDTPWVHSSGDHHLEKILSEVTPVVWLGSGPRLVGRIGSGVGVSASFFFNFRLRMLLHCAGLRPGGGRFCIGELSPGIPVHQSMQFQETRIPRFYGKRKYSMQAPQFFLDQSCRR